jgi:REP element-mobilizing transposase RayT
MNTFPRVPPRLDRLFPHNPVFFVTASTHLRKRLLANTSLHDAFIAFAVRAYSDHNIAVGRYVIMPDHIHLFVCGPEDFELGRWMGGLKQHLQKAIIGREAKELRAASPTGRRLQTPIWQRGFFDHVLRNDESYGQKWNDVRDNPVRAAFVGNADDWPYAGEIIQIDRV